MPTNEPLELALPDLEGEQRSDPVKWAWNISPTDEILAVLEAVK